ncbi:hypothetical protein BDF22DRAFT_690267 [Syncephalis plumigaleata]|nr:hypothetical protein BDF22DRAFT_690267 [Syncephalis plumigaleata]
MAARKDTVKWKREIIPDHKFDYVDVTQFHDKSSLTRFKHKFVYFMIAKSLIEYGFDVFTLVTFMVFGDELKMIPYLVKFIIYIASLSLSTLFFLWEWKKAYQIVKSRDIAHAYTNTTAYRYYCVRSYDNYCLFRNIGGSKGIWGRFATFIYFRLKTWKRLLLVTTPRRALNVATIINFYSLSSTKYRVIMIFNAILVSLWIASAVLTAFACLLYSPTSRRIRGNLKEYVCHKIDKRISEAIMLKSRKRQERDNRERRQLEEDLERARGPPIYKINEKTEDMQSNPTMKRPLSSDEVSLSGVVLAARIRSEQVSSQESFGIPIASNKSTGRLVRNKRQQSHPPVISPVFAPIDQTMYGHSVQYGYHQRLGVDVNAVNSDHEEPDGQFDRVDLENKRALPFYNRSANNSVDNNLPIIPLRPTASPAVSASSGSKHRFHLYDNEEQQGNESDNELSDRYTRPAYRTYSNNSNSNDSN